MRAIFPALCAALLLSTAAQATPGACYSISDNDARAYCLARAKSEPSLCYNIQSADMRAMCHAEVGR